MTPNVNKAFRSALDISQTWFLHDIQIEFHETAGNGADPSVISEKRQGATCRMILCLSGTVKVCVLGNGQHQHFIIPEGYCSLQYCPETCRYIDLPLEHHFRSIQITLSYSAMAQLLGKSRLRNQLDEAFQNQRSIALDRPITPAMRFLMQQVEDACGQGQTCSGPFVVAKALELLWHFSRSWESEEKSSVYGQDRKAMEKACRLLEKNLVEPPSLFELACQVGMSLSKFKEVFRRYYEMPPYAYLRKARMEKAMCLLQLRGARVTETAYDVGYNSVSHFAKAFAAYFGMSPSEARKRCRRKNENNE